MMQEVRNWYEMAAMDLGVARHLDRTYYPKPLEIICYHCQQSAEKVIKALIVYYGAEGGIPILKTARIYQIAYSKITAGGLSLYSHMGKCF